MSSQPRAFTRLPSGCGYSTVLPDMDFETYSEAGYYFDQDLQKWKSVGTTQKPGLFAVGSVVYAQHPSTEVLSLAYNLKDGLGDRLWIPGMAPPADLFEYIATSGLIEAWNVSFEFYIWKYVCCRRMGWPELSLRQLRCAMAKSRAFAYPGALAKAAAVTEVIAQKDKDGTRLLNKFSKPRQPTKNDKRLRIRPVDDLEDAGKLYSYNIDDIRAEAAVSAIIPDLNPDELEFWYRTFEMNARGVAVDLESVNACIAILEQATNQYNLELCTLTGGAVAEATKVQQIVAWLATRKLIVRGLAEDDVDDALARPMLPPDVRRVLEIRQLIGSAGVKKLYAMKRQAAENNRLHELFIYHGARTGRDTGADVQPQNLVKRGPDLRWCDSMVCQKPYGQHLDTCPHCGTSEAFSRPAGWSWEAVDYALDVIKTGSLARVEEVFGDAALTLSGCIRGMFIAAPDKDLICSDFSSIEAVVMAMISGEQWRIDAFRRGEDIYLVSAGRITGTTLAEYIAYKAQHKAHPPHRQKIGKPAELGLGFGGWLGAWRQFDKSDNFSDEQVKENIMAWRDASPAIVELWGGQCRGKPWRPDHFELFGLEGMAIQAVQNPGQCFHTNGIGFGVKDDILFCRLPSGRNLTYHQPRLAPSQRWDNQLELSYMGWNSNPKMGPMGWGRINTYGGRLAENVIQATARDIMAYSVTKLESLGYPIVLRVHDELIAEVSEDFGTIEAFEMLMATMPPWAADWPIRAAGGWRGKRYRKD